MYLLLDTESNGPDLNINAVSILAKAPSAFELSLEAVPSSPTEFRFRYIQDTDLPVDVETFLNNFDKFEMVGGTVPVTLISGEVVTNRYNSTLIDASLPLALTRANKATIFQNL